MQRIARLIVVLALASLSACSFADAHIKAQRAEYDAIAPEYLTYVEADESLTDNDKRLRQVTVQQWDRRITALEYLNDKGQELTK